MRRGLPRGGREERLRWEGWVGKPCARRHKMAPAAPSLAGAMMGLGEEVAS